MRAVIVGLDDIRQRFEEYEAAWARFSDNARMLTQWADQMELLLQEAKVPAWPYV